MKTFSVVKKISINASGDLVFDALTNSERIACYFPLEKVVSSWKVDEAVEYYGTVDGVPFVDYGTIEKLERPAHYQYTYWSTNHGTERTPCNHLTIAYHLSQREQGTHLVVEQRNIRSKDMYELMESAVWDFLLGRLKEYVENESWCCCNALFQPPKPLEAS
jgi:uncharacterized protein YndB with AHSA1/START domain